MIHFQHNKEKHGFAIFPLPVYFLCVLCLFLSACGRAVPAPEISPAPATQTALKPTQTTSIPATQVPTPTRSPKPTSSRAPTITPTPKFTPVAGRVRFEVEAQIGGGIEDVLLRDHLAYVAQGARLVVLDVSDPANPRSIGQTDLLPGPSLQDNLFIADQDLIYWISHGCIEIINIHEPTHPGLATQIPLPFRVDESLIKDNTAYLFESIWNKQERTTLLHVFDLSSPLKPEEIHIIEIDGAINHAVLSGTRIYAFNRSIKDKGVLASIDISDPKDPLYTTYPVPFFDIVTDLPYGFDLPRKTIYDLTDPSSLKAISPLPSNIPSLDWSNTAVASNGLLFIANALSDECNNNKTEMTICNTHLVTIDYRDPIQPRVITGSDRAEWITFQGVRQIKVHEGVLYGIDARGLSMISVKQPDQPHILKQIWAANMWGKQVIQNGMVYRADRLFTDSLYVYDLRNLNQPHFTGLFPPALYDSQMSLVNKDHLYFSFYDDRRWLKDWHWRVVDISDPDQPHEAAHIYEKDIPKCSSSFHPVDPIMTSLYWYASEPLEIHFLDVTQPLNPCLIGVLPHEEADRYSLVDVTWDGKYIYGLSLRPDDDEDVIQLNVYDPTIHIGEIKEVGSTDLPGKDKWSIDRQDDFVYLIKLGPPRVTYWSFFTIDLRDLPSPKLVHAWDSPIKGAEFGGLYDHYALLVDEGGVVAVDISNPGKPTIEGSFPLPESPVIEVHDKRIYVFDEYNDIYVLHLTELR